MSSFTRREEEQKKRELCFFTRFQTLSPVVPHGQPLQPCPPEPDIHLPSPTGRLGIEITEFYRSDRPHLKRIESEQQKILEAAQRIYDNQGEPSVGVRVFWNWEADVKRSARDELANGLAAAVVNNLPAKGHRIEFEQDGDSDSLLPSSIDSLQIDRLIDYPTSHWYAPRADFPPQCSVDAIQTILSKKNLRFENYTGACEHLWLLIVAEDVAPSSWCELPDAVSSHSYSSIFQRVFFLQRIPSKVTELPVVN